MKNLLLCAMFVIFAALASANTGVSESETREVSQRVRRSDDSLWNLFKNDKDKKKKKKKKKTTVKPTKLRTTASTTAAPSILTTKPPTKGKISDKVLKELLKLNSTQQLEQYLGITSAMSMTLRGKASADPPPSKNKVVLGQSAGPGETECGCKLTRQRIFMANPHSHLGIYYPNNCVATNLCAGGCLMPEYQECQPIAKKVVTVDRAYVYFSGGYSIKSHNIEVHSDCACRCKKQKCNDRMEFREDYCACRCKPQFTRENVKCQAPFEFNESICDCFCPFKFRDCPVGQVWHTNSCSCKCPIGQVMIGKQCSAISMSTNNGK